MLGTAADLVSGGAEFANAPPPTVSTLPTSDQGAVIFEGVEYMWDATSGQYINAEDFRNTGDYAEDYYGGGG